MKKTTNPIGTGTMNVTFNVPVDEWTALKAAAKRKGVTFGAYLRGLVFVGAQSDDTGTAAEIAVARGRYYGKCLALLIFSLIALGDQAEARIRRANRGRRIEDINITEAIA